MKHNRIIRREFSKQAPRFGEVGYTLSSQDLLDWIVDRLPLDQGDQVLDVAAGTGHLSLAIAPHVKKVFAVDITRDMLTIAHQETARRNLHNISFAEGNAEHLPYQADGFDLVVSRLAIHHFWKPVLQVREMVRACKPDHRLAIIDLLAPEDERMAKTYNDLERLRDPSHALALSKLQMERLLAEAGILVESIETREVEVDFQRWVQLTGTQPETVEVLKQELMNDIHKGSKTGMRPFTENGSLKFLHVWSIIVGRNNSNTKPLA